MKRFVTLREDLPVSPSPCLPLFLFSLLALSLQSTFASPLTLYAFEEPHMGTLFKIKLYAPDENSARIAATAAFDRIEALDQSLSDYLPESELSKLNRTPSSADPTIISNDLRRILLAAKGVAFTSRGAFDPTTGHFTNLWRRSVRKKTLPTSGQLSAARNKTGTEHFTITTIHGTTPSTITRHIEDLHFDLGGIGKGFAADEALTQLAIRGLTRAAVAAGGDVRVGDPPPGEDGWEIPILAPGREREIHLTTVTLANAAVSSSGDREQFVEIDGRSYSHIVDPRTGLGLTHQVAATVIAPTATLSDSHATALCVLGPDKGLALAESEAGIEALIVVTKPEGEEKRFVTTGFPSREK